jgi:DNA invertase Pin-like site-specific DNA recombinase
MKLAASRGAKIGRPKVTDRPAFARKWPVVRAQLLAGTLSQRKAARDLKIGVATLKRMLDADPLQKEVLIDAPTSKAS